MKNQIFLDKAISFLPEIQKKEINAVRTVTMRKETSGGVTVEECEGYQNRPLKKGDKVILDFGDHQVGYLSLKLGSERSHADAPALIGLHFAEFPSELFESAEDYHGWICASWIEQEEIHVDIIPSRVSLPRRYAFRYVEIEIKDISSKYDLLIENVSCTAVSSARDEDLKVIDTKDPLLKRLDEVACRTLHNCMQKVFEDGPKRDRRLWMGDLRIQALVNYETYRMNDMVKACLYLFAALPGENGQIAGCLFMEPEPEADDVSMFDYSLFFICALLDYYKASGDKETLKELWPTALSQIYLAEDRLSADDIVQDSNELGWCFIDWNLALNKQGSAQGVFLYALLSAIEIAHILGEDETGDRLEALYKGCRDATVKMLWDDDTACFVSGSQRQVSVATQVWMVLGEAVEKEKAAALLQRVMSDPDAVKPVSPYMYHHYIEALIKIGEKETAIQELSEYWGGMIKLGADTFWELYDPDNPHESPYGGTIVNSYCHAWSCGPAYFLRKYY